MLKPAFSHTEPMIDLDNFGPEQARLLRELWFVMADRRNHDAVDAHLGIILGYTGPFSENEFTIRNMIRELFYSFGLQSKVTVARNASGLFECVIHNGLDEMASGEHVTRPLAIVAALVFFLHEEIFSQ